MKNVPQHIIDKVLELGRVEWGATAELSAHEHAEHVERSVLGTAKHFQQEGPQRMHGLYLDGKDIVLAHTGTGPNASTIAQALTGLWNYLHDDIAAVSDEPEEHA